jgi:hypothetical protein
MKKSKSKPTRRRIIILLGILALAILILGFLVADADPAETWSQRFFETMPGFLFAAMSVLILVNQPKQVIGWLFLAYPLYFVIDLSLLLSAGPLSEFSDSLSPSQFVYVWWDSWSFLLIMLPILAIGYVFPSGQWISEKWNRVYYLFVATSLASVLLSTFSISFEIDGRFWPNPNALIPETIFNIFGVLATIGLVVIIVLSIASLIIRFRQAEVAERTQLRWFFYSISLLILNVLVAIFVEPYGALGFITDILFAVSITAIPASVLIAILRFRLWDIDVVVNRALVYGALSATLAGLFSGSVVLINQGTKNIVGEESSTIAALISTVFVASVFQPIKDRIESWIEERISPDSRDIRKDFVELEPAINGDIPIKQFAQILAQRLLPLLSIKRSAIFLISKDNQYKIWIASPKTTDKHPSPKISKVDLKRLSKGLSISASGDFLHYVPIYVPRLDSNELKGLIAIGPRKSGRGFSSDSKKSLAKLGEDFGRALHLSELRKGSKLQ